MINNINVNWMRENMANRCQIKKDYDLEKSSSCYKEVFNGAPFYEEWTLETAKDVLKEYKENNANIWIPVLDEEAIGFLVTTDQIPEEQIKYINGDKDKIRFVEEVGVKNKYRGNRIASELVRRDLKNALLEGKEYLAYRTNGMRYFRKERGESFETAVERIQKEDKLARENGEKIIVPKLSQEEKQYFINQYIELLELRPDLDVSNSTQLFRSIFRYIEYSKNGNNYTFQTDPTGENNDRIFPIINLRKNGFVKTYYNKAGIR